MLFRYGGFVRDVSRLSLGTFASQLVLLATSIPLARLFSPQDFGAFGIIVAASTILAIAATGRYEMAIPLAKDEREAWSLVALAIGVAVCVSALLVVVTGAAPGAVSKVLGLPSGDSSIWLLPACCFAVAVWQVLRMWQSRRGGFAVISRSGVISSALQGGLQIGLGFAGAGAFGLTGAYLISRAVNAATLCEGTFTRPPGRQELLAVARRWRRFPALMLLPALLNAISVGASTPYVGALFGVAVAGLFSFAMRLLAAPSALIGQAVAGVFYPRMAELEREGMPATAAVERLTVALTSVSIPLFTGVGLFGPELFAWVFGQTWRQAGVIGALLAPWLAVNFISSPVSSYATVRNQLGRLLALAVLETGMRLGGLALGMLAGSSLTGFAVYSAVGSAISTYYIVWTLSLAGADLRAWLRKMRGIATGGGLAVVLATAGREAMPFHSYAVISLALLVLLTLAGAKTGRAALLPVRSLES